MSLRSSDPNLIETFIPSSERNAFQPTTIHAKPLHGVQMSVYQDSLISSDRRGIVRMHTAEAHRKLIRQTVVQIENVILADGTFRSVLTDNEECINFLTTLSDVEAYNEILSFLQGTSRLTEDQEKNLPEPPIAMPSSLPLLPEPGT